MKVGDLFIALGFQVDDKKLKDFNDNIKTGTVALGSMSATAAGAVYAINRFTASSVDSSVKLKNLTDQTGAASEEVQRFYNVAGRLNTDITLDDTINAFTQLSDTIAQAKLGQGPIGEAGMLGLDNIGNMTPGEIIQQLRQNFRDNVKAWGSGDERVIQNLMKAIGLGPEFIQTIKATDEEFERLYNNPILDGSARDQLVALAQSTKEMNFEWELLKGNLSAGFAPTIIEFMQNLRTVLQETFDVTEKVSAKFSEFKEEHDPNGSLTRNAGTAAGLAAGAKLLMNPNPIVKGTGGLILLGVGVNDLGNYLQGEPSSIEDALNGGKKGVNFIKGMISEELMKTKEQQEEDRRRLLNSEPVDPTGFGRLGGQSFNQTNNISVESTGDPRQVALEVLTQLDGRTYREAEFNLGFNASGSLA